MIRQFPLHDTRGSGKYKRGFDKSYPGIELLINAHKGLFMTVVIKIIVIAVSATYFAYPYAGPVAHKSLRTI